MNSFDIIVNAIDKASKVFDGIGQSASGIGTKVESSANTASGALGKVESSSSGAAKALGGVAKVAGGFVVANALTGLGTKLFEGAKGAAEDEAAMLRLQKTVDNTGTSFNSVSGEIDKAISNGQKLAFQDGEVANALNSLITATGSTEEGMKRLNAAQDLARGTGMSLEQAAKLLGKTSDENTSTLRRYGIEVSDTATAQDVLNEVDSRFGGQAATFAESGAGQMAIMQNEVGELFEALGTFLLPIIITLTGVFLQLAAIMQTQIIPAIQSFIGFIQPLIDLISGNLTPILIALGTAITIMAVASIPALIAALTAQAAILWANVAAWIATNAAMLPVIAVALAIGVAIAALYLAWQSNFLGIQDITRAVIDFIKPYIEGAISGIVAFVEGALPVVQAIFDTVFNAVRAVVEVVFPIIATVAQTYINILKTEIEIALAVVQAVFNTVFPIIQSIVETVFPIIVSVATTAMSTFQSVIETAINVVSAVFNNVFLPIQGIVSDVFNTISGLVSSVFSPAMDAIGTGVDRAKAFFDSTFVAIQGIVDDVFGTIVDLIYDLWTSGAVADIGHGVETVKGFFSGIYDTMHGFGADMVQGLIDGATSLIKTLEGVWETISGIADKIIKVKNLITSPSRLMRRRGIELMTGLTQGVESQIPGYENTWSRVADIGDRTVSDYTGGNNTGSGSTGGTGGRAPTTGSGNTGGTAPRGPYTGPPDFYYDKPDNGQGSGEPGVIGEPAFGFNNDAGHFDNPIGGGGGSSFGVLGRSMATAASAMTTAANTMEKAVGASGSAIGNNRGMEAFLARNQRSYSYRRPGLTISINRARLLTDPDVLDKYLSSNDPSVRRWAQGLQSKLASGEIHDPNTASLRPLMEFFRMLMAGRGGHGTPGTGNTYNIYGMQVGDVQREIERAERRLATNWSVTNGG